MATARDERDFKEEIEAHIRLEADALIEDGMPPEAALASARRRFGNVTKQREQFYESSRFMWLDHLSRDLRYAWRQIRQSPLPTAIIVLSLAVGIGVNTSIFSLTDQALVRPLPVQDPDSLVQLHWEGRFIGGGRGYGSLISHPLFRTLRQTNEMFADLAARSYATVGIDLDGRNERVAAEVVSGSYFRTFGVGPHRGRVLDDQDDEVPGGHPVVVLSYAFWKNELGGDDQLIGQTIRINRTPCTIVGVAAEGFGGTDWALGPALFMPLMMNDLAIGNGRLETPRERFLHVFARLKPGVSRADAQSALAPIFASQLRADMERADWPTHPTPEDIQQYLASELLLLPGSRGHAHIGTRVRDPMIILAVATALLLLLACLNVANLSLARSLARRRVTALQSALGAPRRRLLRAQLIESGLLAALGALVGVALAPWVSRTLLSFLADEGVGKVQLQAGLDLRVLMIAIVTTAIVTLLSGLLPALFASSIHPSHALKQQSSSVAGGFRVRKALVVVQFTLALALLMGAGGFARTLGALKGQGPGFETKDLVSFQVSPRDDGYRLEEGKRLIAAVERELRQHPAFDATSVAAFEILQGGGWGNYVTVDGIDRVVSDVSIEMNSVGAEFFDTLGISMRRGRHFNAEDRNDSSEWGEMRSAVVNHLFAEAYLPDQDPIGARVGFGTRDDVTPSIEIVGVVQGFRDHGLREPAPQIFFSIWERPLTGATFYLRSSQALDSTASLVRQAVARVDPNLKVTELRTLDQRIDLLLRYERMLAALAVAFGAMATFLAMVGLYGVIAFSAESRTKEIGIRIAVGSPPWSAARLMVREALQLAGIGVLIGLPLSWLIGRSIESRLFGVHPMEPSTLAMATLVLTLVCLCASALPALRISRIDPLIALRSE